MHAPRRVFDGFGAGWSGLLRHYPARKCPWCQMENWNCAPIYSGGGANEPRQCTSITAIKGLVPGELEW
jgi:hypothetical protein